MGGLMVQFDEPIDFDAGRQVGVMGYVGDLRHAKRVRVETTRDAAIEAAKGYLRAWFERREGRLNV